MNRREATNKSLWPHNFDRVSCVAIHLDEMLDELPFTPPSQLGQSWVGARFRSFSQLREYGLDPVGPQFWIFGKNSPEQIQRCLRIFPGWIVRRFRVEREHAQVEAPYWNQPRQDQFDDCGQKFPAREREIN
jgi:hypothetical protein